MRRAPAYALVVVLLSLLGLGLTAAPASAHASLVSTDPAEGAVLAEAPDEVRFTFDESVSLVPHALRAFDAKGRPVEIEAHGRGKTVTGDLPEDLADGTYVVAWRVVSADGHPIAGSLTFHVGAPSRVVVPPRTAADDGGLDVLQGVVHGVDYTALLLAAGLAFFLGWTARGVRLPDPVRRRLLLTLRGSALVAVAMAAVAVPLSGAYQVGSGPSGLLEAASLDPDLVGEDLLVLALQVLGLGAAAWAAGRSRQNLAVDLATALAVWSPALVGHTRAYEPSSLLVVTDALHLTAGAVWLGGLVGLTVTLVTLAGRPREAALLLTRFSAAAAVLLAVLSLSGVLMGWRILGSWSGLVETTWGRLLLVKVGLVLLVVGAAAFNRLRVLPQVSSGGHDQQRRGALLVRKVVVAEAALLVAVLGVTGFLTQEPPGGEQSTSPAGQGTGATTAVAGDVRVLAVLDARAGLRRRLLVQLQNSSGEPFDAYDAPSVALSSDDVDLGPVPVVATASGTYAADVTFPRAGAWQVRVAVRLDEFTSPVTILRLDVR